MYIKGATAENEIYPCRDKNRVQTLRRLLYIDVPGYYKYNEIQFSSVIKEFIEDFKKKYRKQDRCLIKGE